MTTETGFRGLRAVTGQPPTPRPEPRLTEAEEIDDRRRSRSSILGDAMRRDAALSIGCGEHHAAPGVWCFNSDRSPVRGVCGSRYHRAIPEWHPVKS
jgi:hypothetical protein